MASKVFDLLTVCGLDELPSHGPRAVSHVLSILDPGTPEPDFGTYPPHRRTTLRFHDIVDPAPGMIPPSRADIEAILAFGDTLDDGTPAEGHLLVHCHMGISRSTAAMTILLAQAHPEAAESTLLDRVAAVRPQAWPNLAMIELADGLLDRQGRLRAAVTALYRRRLASRPELAEGLSRIGRGRELEAAREGVGPDAGLALL